MKLIEDIKIYWQYLKYVMEHKKNVAQICYKHDLPIHALSHDMSKLTLSEFKPYAMYFYKDKEKYRDSFQKAWEHHYKLNPHHWEHWLDDNGKPMDIPIYHIACMVADWEAMSVKFGDTPQAFYLQNYFKIKLSYNTRVWVEQMLGINKTMMLDTGRTLEELFNILEPSDFSNLLKKENEWLKDKYGIDFLSILKNNK